MKWWQRLLSYFSEVSIERTSSPHHKYLQVSAIEGRYQLSTEKSIYSFDDLYLNFYKAFHRTELPKEGADVLVLGLGLASIPWMLEHTFNRQYNYVAVDIDPEIIRMASQYRLAFLQAPIEIICADAAVFLDVDQRQYDMICMDVFMDDIVPESLTSHARLEQLRSKIAPGGFLLWNWLYRSGQDKQRTEKFYREVFLKSGFREVTCLDVDGNWVLQGRV